MFLSETLILINLHGVVASSTTSGFSTNLQTFRKGFSISSDINGAVRLSVWKLTNFWKILQHRKKSKILLSLRDLYNGKREFLYEEFLGHLLLQKLSQYFVTVTKFSHVWLIWLILYPSGGAEFKQKFIWILMEPCSRILGTQIQCPQVGLNSYPLTCKGVKNLTCSTG